MPTHVCLMPHILPNAFTLGISLGGRRHAQRELHRALGAEPRHGDRVVQGGVREPGRRHHEAHRHRHALPGHVQACRPGHPAAPGTDAALALAIIHEVIEHKWYDQDFIDNWTYGFDELAERVKDWTPERAAEVCQIDADDVREAARIMGNWGPSP
ncbi:MAG: hypothetical protein V8S24_02510 [Gordonibacter pamelaeae]